MGAVSSTSIAAELPARVICILGMHRSGTSCLVGSLQDLGLGLGDCHTWNPHNLKGNRENQAFVDLNDAVLSDNGGTWDAPPKKVTWSSERLSEAIGLLGANAAETVFGFKDPRTLLVLKGWKRVYPAMEFVGIFRHPEAVARSLHTRSEMPREQALHLWYTYNRLLLREYQRRPFPLFCFDQEDSRLLQNIRQVAGQIGLATGSAATGFYSAELRNNLGAADAPLPWKISRLYRKLRDVSL